ncbi:AfsR/SARP family transcriptional regulator [Kineosporia succinea]|uniref:DNA-binding SARP family transcriptional activator/tetratricopeptide (TPR) repeat protein n=1 Tax=Kineosporia succinea TaxID=84632 RepID=A0ABT9PF15_9ACTN|nr:BTAD domain-containing putative transcriptional regulator [Kineosporia succinea]MDP9830984.1 DNA-binding SARP family transcriptional activator/tetratricopeptide (TPR) repeat protein [Kineosporia succinea]
MEHDTRRGDLPPLKLQVLGPLRIWRDGVEVDAGPWQRRCLLGLLLAHNGQPVGMNELVDTLWPSDPPVSAVNIVHKYVGALRRLMEPDLAPRDSGSWLLRSGNGYRFVADPRVLDLARFVELHDRARTAARGGDDHAALLLHQEALHLWNGPAGEDAAGSPVFAGVNQQLFDSATEAADLALRTGEHGRPVAVIRRVCSWDPLNESLHARLILLLAGAGHQAEALTVHRTVTARLADELGLDPGPELRAAQQQVLRDEAPALTTPAVRPETGQRPRPAQLPADLSMFVGREEQIAAVTRLIEQRSGRTSTGPLVLALSGMGGVGKSTLAVHLAHRFSAAHPDGQLYVDLRGFDGDGEEVSTPEALATLLHSLGVPGASVPSRIEAQVGLYRTASADRRLIVLIDNARSVQHVRPLIPNSASALVIVTSRTPLAGLAAIEGAVLLPLDLPSAPSARAMMAARLQALPRPADDAVIDEIVDLCGRLPLALALVAARALTRPTFPLQVAADELRAHSTVLHAFPDGGGDAGPRSVFRWSYRHLSAEAARLFRLLSLSIGPSISAAACASLLGGEPAPTRRLLGELLDAALVAEVAQDRFSAHLLVRAYAEELCRQTESGAERAEASRRLLQHYRHTGHHAIVALRPKLEPIPPAPAVEGVHPQDVGTFDQAMSWFAAEHQVLMAAVNRAGDPQFGVSPWQLALSAQTYLHWGGFFHDWKTVMQTALTAARAQNDRLGQAYALRSLAGAHHYLGEGSSALECLYGAQELFAELGRVRELSFVQSNLGDVLTRLGRFDEALAAHEEVLRTARSISPTREVVALLQVGVALMDCGEYALSETRMREALKLNQELGKPEIEGSIRIDIGSLFARMGQDGQAAAEWEAALPDLRAFKHRPDELKVLLDLADARIRLGDRVRAREAWRSAVTLAAGFQDHETGETKARLRSIEAALDD